MSPLKSRLWLSLSSRAEDRLISGAPVERQEEDSRCCQGKEAPPELAALPETCGSPENPLMHNYCTLGEFRGLEINVSHFGGPYVMIVASGFSQDHETAPSRLYTPEEELCFEDPGLLID
ncbi:unnamed protein product [Lactuca saligna]|uniref:Uncharacterized protein n=1 Tax=Lactuca saligna TaxID=75948 RepID=A0AA35ZRZ6_LACSI|nr:unnamed protein product [Lactuca saligna]